MTYPNRCLKTSVTLWEKSIKLYKPIMLLPSLSISTPPLMNNYLITLTFSTAKVTVSTKHSQLVNTLFALSLTSMNSSSIHSHKCCGLSSSSTLKHSDNTSHKYKCLTLNNNDNLKYTLVLTLSLSLRLFFT